MMTNNNILYYNIVIFMYSHLMYIIVNHINYYRPKRKTEREGRVKESNLSKL